MNMKHWEDYCDNKKLRKHVGVIAMGGFNHEIFEITKL